MFEFVRDLHHGLVQQLSYECQRKLNEVRFLNIYILLHIICYSVPLTIIIVFAINA